uniref:Uncharacterized protein n=1 Tax=Cairina moschata TaxID=8855 RepID=A0A8C3BUE8_CAIMO
MEFTHKRGKRRDDSGLGSVLDVLLANARLVLGVSGAAVLAIATLAVKRLIDRATSPRDDGDPKAEQKTLEESWQDLALIKATQKPPKRQRREDLSEPLLPPAPPPAPGDARGQGAGLHGWMKITLMRWGRLRLCSRLPGSTTLFLA